MKIAIVTGASSGIGREFVHQIAKKEHLDEIWIIARRKDRLNELKNEITGTVIRPIPLDLIKEESIESIAALLKEKNQMCASLSTLPVLENLVPIKIFLFRKPTI